MYLASSDLKIYIRTEELLNRMYPRLRNFPKSEKFALSQDIRLTFFCYVREYKASGQCKA